MLVQTLSPRARQTRAISLAALCAALLLLFLLVSATTAASSALLIGDRYVAVSGSDLMNDCADPDLPCLTVAYALSQADPHDVIRVAEGVYVENLVINAPVTLEGGYEADTWTRDIDQYVTVLDGTNGQTIPGDWDGDAVRYPMVIEHEEGYRMYYNNGELGGAIGLASSPDGVTWARNPANPILTPGQPGEWDDARLEAPFVLRMGVNDYKMWYSGYEGCGIGLATSSDGVNWTRYPGNPVLAVGDQDWNNICVQHPSVMYEGGQYKMWMMTVGDAGTGWQPTYSYATSPDGIAWTWHPANPVFQMQPANEWESIWMWRPYVFRLTPNPYQLWYTAYGSGGAAIGYATSPDGINWVRHNGGAAPVMAGTPGEWDEGFAADSTVGFVIGNVFAMYYDNNHSMGLAHSPDGIVWTKWPTNPVFTPGVPPQWGQSVVLFNAGSDGAILDGFTITHGDACATGGGGGVGVEGVVVTIQNSILRENNAAGPCGGGGVEVRQPGGFVNILHSQIISNTAADAGGVDVWDGSSAYIFDTLIANNSARGGLPGGGVEVSVSSVLTIENSTISGNVTPANGGGIAVDQEARATVLNCSVLGNHSDNMGGGIWSGPNSFLHVAGSEVSDNSAGQSGGGVATEQVNRVEVMGSTIANNHSGWAGGGLILSGGSALLADSQILANHAEAWAGGVWIASGEAHVVNVLVEGNQTVQYSGGGMEINGDWGPAHLLLEHAVLQGNVSTGNGGGLNVWHSSADLLDVQFLGNHNSESGGGLAVSAQGAAVVMDSLFNENSAIWGGALFVGELGNLVLERSVVTANHADDSGGGLFAGYESSVTVAGSAFDYNSAGSQGGGLWHHGSLTMMDTVVRHNVAGGIGGGITSCCPEGGGPLTMTNCLVANNEGTYGGGIAPFWFGVLTNVTVTNNTCAEAGCVGGVDAARNDLNQMHWFRNSILWGNQNSDLGCEPGFCRADASDIGVGGVYSGMGNLSTDPQFVDAAGEDYHLAAWSPVIDAGTPYGAPDHDYDGDPRPLGYGFDMGYDEFVGTPDPLYVDIFTNKAQYVPGDTMVVGLEVVNATRQPRPGVLLLTLSTPWGDNTLLTLPLVRPPKSTLFLPQLFSLTLPTLPDGQYAWLLSWQPYGEADAAPWSFSSP